MELYDILRKYEDRLIKEFEQRFPLRAKLDAFISDIITEIEGPKMTVALYEGNYMLTKYENLGYPERIVLQNFVVAHNKKARQNMAQEVPYQMNKDEAEKFRQDLIDKNSFFQLRSVPSNINQE